MKKLVKVGGSLLICLVLLLLVLSVTGFEPNERRPGLWLKGNLVTTPVTDWSFTDKYQEIKIQTRTWYLVPHSVTIYCVAYNGQFYVDSLYRAGLRPFPHGKSWTENVARDPHVRLKIGDQLFDRTLSPVTDPVEKAGALQTKAKKYPQFKVPVDATIYVYRVMPD